MTNTDIYIPNHLPTTFRTKPIAHLQLWHGSDKHLTGYDSRDRQTIAKQIDHLYDMGFRYLNFDWYGPRNEFQNVAMLRWREALEIWNYQVLTLQEDKELMYFSLCFDSGIYKWEPSEITQRVIFEDSLRYAKYTYLNSPAYHIFNFKAVVTFFNQVTDAIDWTAPQVILGDNTYRCFLNASGLQHVGSNGCFAWVNPGKPGWHPQGLNWGKEYLEDFYKLTASARSDPNQLVIAGAWRGFDDTHPLDPTRSVWDNRPPRKIAGRKGATMLDTLALVPDDAEFVMIPYNDLEERSDIEKGIIQ
jgi:hypothetical protein